MATSSHSKLLGFLVLLIFQFRVLVNAAPRVPCYFVFGDSLVDNGNNDALLTNAKANFRPYGIDFPGGVPNRFTNGLNLADFIAKFLGFPNFIPPYANATLESIITGVNYGSGGAGILGQTGLLNLGSVISLDNQLLNHQVTRARLATLFGGNQAYTNKHLSKCIYTVGMGSNDYINNYLMPPLYPAGTIYTPDQFAQILINKYLQQIKRLYNLGARKVAIFGLGLIGCTPAEITRFGTNGAPCVNRINGVVQLFNNRLQPLVDELNTYLPSAKFTFINITSISSGNPTAFGITVLNVPCCTLRPDGQCAPNTTPCSNRNQYAFFDGFHPTEALNLLTASAAFNATSPTFAYPYDINNLAQL